MRIAIFTDTFYPEVNGVAKTLKRFTDYLENQGIQYRVFAPESSNRQSYSNEIHRFKSLPFILYPECRLAFPNMLHVKEELQQFNPDIIHVATPFNVGLCGIHYAKKLAIPLVGSYHTDFDKYLSYYDLQFLSKVLWRYMRWFHRSMRKIFVPSLDTKEHLLRHGFTNLKIWPRGIDSELFHPNLQSSSIKEKYNIKEKYILLYVGRLALEKDVMLLPSIQQHLPEELKHKVHWLVVGDGPQKEELMKQASPNMTFTGFLTGKELSRAYASADLFIFPSATETFGNVVLESMASGTPVIGVNKGGVRGIIRNQVTGVLCEEKDVKQFTNAVTNLLTNDSKRNELSLNGREYAKSQSWESIFAALLQDYEAALKEERVGALA